MSAILRISIPCPITWCKVSGVSDRARRIFLSTLPNFLANYRALDSQINQQRPPIMVWCSLAPAEGGDAIYNYVPKPSGYTLGLAMVELSHNFCRLNRVTSAAAPGMKRPRSIKPTRGAGKLVVRRNPSSRLSTFSSNR